MDSKEKVDNGVNGKRARDEPDSVQDNVVSNAIRDKRNREDTVDIKVRAQKDQRGKQRNAVDPSKLTPEYISAQRALREERKRQKKQEQTKSTETTQHNSSIHNEFSTNFIKRPMLRLPNMVEFSDSMPVRIMSYNVLAQCLIRRDLFPDNGNALKWKNRSKVLAAELLHYKPDILCMQEVDKDKAGTFWTETLAKMDHKSVFLTAQGKLHGNLISYNERMFSVRDSSMIDYDQTEPDGLPKQIQSRNTGMFVALDFKLKPNTGVIVGTTHMFWHPKGSYERTRQMAIFMEEAARYATCYNWPVILAGDFNSECFDSPYLCASAKPTDIDEDARNILRESLRYPFINVQLEGDAQEEPQDVESSKKDLHGEALIELQIDKLVEHFNKVPFEAKSLYGYGNRKVHPSNVHPKGIGEPIFSNWAAKWRGLLDYIFVLHPIDSQPPEGYVSHGVRLLELLRMPEPQEMGPEPSGQPRENQYPSDHLCLMATIEFNNYP